MVTAVVLKVTRSCCGCVCISLGMSLSQVRKAYGDDMQGMEAHEEMARMREHVLTEVGVRVN